MEISEVLEQMNQLDGKGNPRPFSISFVTYNRSTKAGGELKTFKKAVLKTPTASYTRNLNTYRQFKKSKVQNHFKNATRNICELGTDQITRINIWLIFMFNNRPVVWNIYG